MAKYKVLKLAYINGSLVEPDTVIESTTELTGSVVEKIVEGPVLQAPPAKGKKEKGDDLV